MAEFPVKDEDIKALRLKVLRALAVATYPKEAIAPLASQHGLTVPDLKSLIDGHGYPDKAAMARHVIELSNGTAVPAPADKPQRPLAAPAVVGAPPQFEVFPRASATTPGLPDARIETLLNAASKSEKARTRRLGVRVHELVAELRGLVNTEAQEREASAKERAEKERLLAEVKQLEEQLAAKKAALRTPVKKASGTPAAKSDNAAIRAWAATQDIECPGFGRVPAAVREAYEAAAHPEAGQ